MDNQETNDISGQIAIIGMTGRFPGARTIEAFWQNLCDGVESISFFTDEELLEAGIAPDLLNDPNYVKARATLDDIEMFDAAFFGVTPLEAKVMAPQHRLFLEAAWTALENAGYDPESYDDRIGVFAGSNMSSYLYHNLLTNQELLNSIGMTQILLGHDKDHVPLHASYKLNLKGPSLNVSTACSTSLVTVHLACQSLLDYHCDMALAGGVSVIVPQKAGYLYQQDGIGSPDGHCRTFDAKAQGTVFSSGVGLVVLKRLEDAIADGDFIYATILGSAINNDGSLKVGYTAPSVTGQAEVILDAQLSAGVEPETITYIEAHGTGTSLGDPIEVEALTQAFRMNTEKKAFCAIGSLKSNLGHMDTAAGIGGLIKTVLALKHKQIPPSLHFEEPNPKIDFANSPFYVNTSLAEWQRGSTPRRAGVSSFGLGGTNAHVVLEEALDRGQRGSAGARKHQLLLLSAKTEAALDVATANLAEHLTANPLANLADIAYTLQVGRQPFAHRRMLVCTDVERADAAEALSTLNPQRVFTGGHELAERQVVFMFAGQGAQYVNMGLGLYQVEPLFGDTIDQCCEILKAHLGFDLRDVLYPSPQRATEASQQLQQTSLTQPALFVIEYALAQLWMTWGVHPKAMIGHSIGEYVAACLAGVFSLEDALALVAIRGQMMQEQAPGEMLAVPLSESDLKPFLGTDISLAAINSPSLCVVSGKCDAIERLESRLRSKNLKSRRLHTSHAFHSEMMAPMLQPFTEYLQQIKLHAPQIPYISNLTGTWIRSQDATDPRYWAKHLRQTVRFSEGLQTIFANEDDLLLEVAPGQTLSGLAKRHPDFDPDFGVVLASLRHPKVRESDNAFLMNILGKLWLAGVAIDWAAIWANERRRRLPLPTYPFERQRYWIEPATQIDGEQPYHALRVPATSHQPLQKRDIADWFYIPSWKPVPLPALQSKNTAHRFSGGWLVFSDTSYLGLQLVKKLKEGGGDVITVRNGTTFDRLGDGVYSLNPSQSGDYDALFDALRLRGKMPQTVVHLWNVTSNTDGASSKASNKASADKAQTVGFYSLLFIAQALKRQNFNDSLQIEVISNQMQAVGGEALRCPEKATLLGPCKIIPQEMPNLKFCSIDIDAPPLARKRWQEEKQVEQLLDELQAESPDPIVAHRGRGRWVQTFEPVQLAKPTMPQLRERGVYLITGGLGHIGLILAEYMARTVQARLILTGRSSFPNRSAWAEWLDAHSPSDKISRQIVSVQKIEALGGEVLICTADVADRQQLAAVIAQAEEQFGQLNGVIHAAGTFSAEIGQTIDTIGELECKKQFHPKIDGLLNLAALLHGKNLDFCLLMSSLSSILGGLGYVAYSAANLFMDAFVQAVNLRQPVPWISVNWDGWQMAAKDASEASPRAETIADLAITPEEGVETFARILSVKTVPQIVVSTGRLQTRIDQWIHLESLREEKSLKKTITHHPRPNLATRYVAPRNTLEAMLGDIWGEMFGIEPIGIYDNFLELGGHSLLAVQILSRINQSCGVSPSLTDLFESGTVANLAEWIEKMQSADRLQAPNASIPHLSRDQNLPLSFVQQQMWLAIQLEGESGTYNMPGAARLIGHLDLDALKKSLWELVRRHETLRTTFTAVDGQPMQVIGEPYLNLNVIDLTHHERTMGEAEVQRIAEKEAKHSFDLRKGPLLRIRLLQLDRAEHVLLANIHHLVSDGWSIDLFIRDMAALYTAFVKGEPSPLPELSIQYADYAHWQRDWLKGEVIASQLDYWREQLADAPPYLELPTDRPRPTVQRFRGTRYDFSLPQTLSKRLQKLSVEAEVTQFMTLLAVFKVLLMRYSGQEDVIVGTPIAGRTRLELEPLIGCFVNTLVLRTDLSDNPSARKLLKRVQKVTLDAYRHQDVPFEKVVKALQPERNLSYSPLFQVMFQFMNTPRSTIHLPGLTWTSLGLENTTAKYDLMLTMQEEAHGLTGDWQYNTDLFDAATIERITEHFQMLLEAIVEDADQNISELSMMTADESEQLIDGFNADLEF